MFIGYSTKYRSIIEELIPENQLRGAFIINGEKGKLKILFTLTPENPALIQEYRLSGYYAQSLPPLRYKVYHP